MNKKSLSSAVAFAFAAVLTLTSAAWSMAPHAADPNTPPPPAWVQWGPMIALFAIFYFLMIRPQQKQRKEREAMMNGLKKGDRIVTTSGFVVTVANVGPKFLDVKLSDDVKVTMLKSGVSEIIPSTESTEVVETVSK